MVISGSAERSGKISSCSVDGLPLVLEVDSAGYLRDENRGKVLFPVTFMYTQIVYFSHFDFVVFNTSQHRHSSDARNKLLFLVPNSN